MARVDLRLRAWGWLTRRMVSVAKISDAEVIALQAKQVPVNAVTNWLFGAVAPGVDVADRTVPGPAGSLKVRVYRPGGRRHRRRRRRGGRSSFTSTAVASRLAAWTWATGYAVWSRPASGGRRLRGLPARAGDRYPAAVEDCYAALAWAAGNAAELGATGRIGVMGESAGGNLAAVSCLIARERGGPAISHQALIYPATDMTERRRRRATRTRRSCPPRRSAPTSDSTSARTENPLTRGHRRCLRTSRAAAGVDPGGRARPDPRDGVRYAAALRAAGVPVRFTEYVGMTHGFVNFPGLSRAAHQAMAEVCAEQSAALVPPRACRNRSRRNPAVGRDT